MLSQEDSIAISADQKEQLHLNNLKVCNKINKVITQTQESAGGVQAVCVYESCVPLQQPENRLLLSVSLLT